MGFVLSVWVGNTQVVQESFSVKWAQQVDAGLEMLDY